MHVCIFTQNLANRSNVTASTVSNASTLPADLDIYVEFTQENNLTHYTRLLPTELPLYTSHDLNQVVSKHKPSQFNIITRVFAKPGLRLSHESGHISLNSSAGKGIYGQLKQAVSGIGKTLWDYSTKGAVWIHLRTEYAKFLFVNMHLPVDTSSPDMGNEYRKECFLSILSQLPPLGDSLLIVGGDLNFRMQMQMHVQDQLTAFLAENPQLNLRELSNTGPTCKFTTNCRGQRRCYDRTRTPSACDRVLANKPVQAKSKSVILDPSLDHDGVIVSFSYPVRGGRRTRRRVRTFRSFRTDSRKSKGN
jgi:hypothetical protein